MSGFWHTMYAGHPWYTGGVWSNVFVLFVVGPIGWVWSLTKYWPLHAIHHRLDELHAKHDALHARHDEHAAVLEAITTSLAELHRKHDALARGTGPDASNVGG